MTVPAYTYQEPSQTYSPPQPVMPPKKVQAQKQVQDKSIAEKDAISTSSQVQHASQTFSRAATKVSEAINLVGDKKVVPKPLIKLLGKALGAHLVYPKIALDFKVHGIAYVSFVLHPDGTLTAVSLAQSSSAGILDEEAISAVSAMSPVKDVSKYLNKPTFLVVGIIFN